MKYQCENCHKTFTHPAKHIEREVNQPNDYETYVCPFCHSKEYSEFVEPQPEIASVKSVPLEEVDAWLAKGYIVKELYAKTATLIMCKTPEAPESSQAKAEAAYKKLDEAHQP